MRRHSMADSPQDLLDRAWALGFICGMCVGGALAVAGVFLAAWR